MNPFRSTLVAAVVSTAVLATPVLASPLDHGSRVTGTRVTSTEPAPAPDGTRVTSTEPAPAPDGTRVTSTEPAPAPDGTRVTAVAPDGRLSAAAEPAPGRYCDVPEPGWVCFYEDSGQRGNSVGFSVCGRHYIPSWLKVSSYDDRQTGGAYAVVRAIGGGYVLFRTIGGGGPHDLGWWENDRAGSVLLFC